MDHVHELPYTGSVSQVFKSAVYFKIGPYYVAIRNTQQVFDGVGAAAGISEHRRLPYRPLGPAQYLGIGG